MTNRTIYRKKAPSKSVHIRFHFDELKKIDKKRGQLNRSDYIRKKALK